jgi:hypothetical protein
MAVGGLVKLSPSQRLSPSRPTELDETQREKLGQRILTATKSFYFNEYPVYHRLLTAIHPPSLRMCTRVLEHGTTDTELTPQPYTAR